MLGPERVDLAAVGGGDTQRVRALLPQGFPNLLFLLASTVTLFLNFLASLAWFCVDTTAGSGFGLSILWVLLFTPCSFLCWYRPMYKAFRCVTAGSSGAGKSIEPLILGQLHSFAGAPQMSCSCSGSAWLSALVTPQIFHGFPRASEL